MVLTNNLLFMVVYGFQKKCFTFLQLKGLQICQVLSGIKVKGPKKPKIFGLRLCFPMLACPSNDVDHLFRKPYLDMP